MVAAGAMLVPSPVPAQAAFSWLGFTLGIPVASYRTVAGDPLVVVRLPEQAREVGIAPADAPNERQARFLLAPDGSAFTIVTEQRGVVSAIEAFAPAGRATAPRTDLPADREGFRIGDDAAALGKLTGIRRSETAMIFEDREARLVGVYGTSRGRIVSIRWAGPPPEGTGASPPGYTDPPAADATNAVLVVQPGAARATRWEALYLAFHRCDASAPWRENATRRVESGGRSYDVAAASCESSGQTREFWFDVTGSIGRPSTSSG